MANLTHVFVLARTPTIVQNRFVQDQNRIPVRGDPHILVVGDPGLGKSQMLHAVSAVCPRGVYVCGNTTTTAGLTVTLHKETGGDYALEAGALVRDPWRWLLCAIKYT